MQQELVGNGTNRRVRALFDAHFDGVWRTLRRLGQAPAAADDLAQETFVTAARKLDAIEPGCERAFLVGIAVRLAANARRRRDHRETARSIDVDEIHVPSRAPLPDVQVETSRRL